MRGRTSSGTRGRDAALLALSLGLVLGAVGCATPRQAAGVGLILVGTVAAAAGMAATGNFNETPDPSQPVSARSCIDRCTHGSDSAVDALLVAGGAAAVLAGETLVSTAPTRVPATTSAPASPAVLAPPPGYAAPAAAPAAGSAAQSPEPVAPSPTRCLGPLREPALAGCAP